MMARVRRARINHPSSARGHLVGGILSVFVSGMICRSARCVAAEAIIPRTFSAGMVSKFELL